MKHWTLACVAMALTVSSLGGCARNTQVIAPEKEFVPAGSSTPWKIAGVFDKKDTSVVISINGDNVIRGRFPPMTPRLTANGTYGGKPIHTTCAFSSDVIAGRNAGFRLQIAEAIVSKATKSGGNTCDVTVGGQPATTLYF
jgi:hypothetical protein